MSDSLLLTGFVLLVVAAAAWLWLTNALFERLKLHHPTFYQDIGSPTLSEDLAGLIQLLSLVYGPKLRQLEDPALLRIRQVMSILLPSFLTGFLILAFAVISRNGG